MLNGVRILIVEDEWLWADALHHLLASAGAVVPPPAGTVRAAQAAIDEAKLAGSIDLATLDTSLHGEPVFPIADRLAAIGIPFVFISEGASTLLPLRHRHHRFISKPYREGELLPILARRARSRPRLDAATPRTDPPRG